MRQRAPVIEAHNLARRYGRIVALRPLTFSARAGERIGVVGPNGAGKSTLLSLLGRQLRPTHGSLALFGRPTHRSDHDTRAEIGYVGHQPWLYDELTPLENLTFFRRLYGLSQDLSFAAAAVERVGLGGAATTPVSQLSRGQQQRLALARATLHRPRLLLLDEPDASLDPLAIARLPELLGLDARRPHPEDGWHPTIVLATHDLDLALHFCQRLLVLVEGRCVLDAATETLTAASLRVLYAGAEGDLTPGPFPSEQGRSVAAWPPSPSGEGATALHPRLPRHKWSGRVHRRRAGMRLRLPGRRAGAR